MQKKTTALIGAHLSIQGGIHNAFLEATKLRCTTMQIFTKSNRQWGSKELTAKEIELFKATQKQSSIHTIVVHASYLINLASPDKRVYHASIKALKEELLRCDQLSIDYLVLHPGSSVGKSKEEGINQVIKALNEILNEYAGNTMILLENMAGQGNSLASTFEELAALHTGITNHKAKVGFCFDTCHAFAAGYPLSTLEECQATFKRFDIIAGITHIKAIHLNDSKKECGCHVDRHEDIGKGHIGIEAFRFIINNPSFASIPKILETPKKSLDDHARNLEIIRSLLD